MKVTEYPFEAWKVVHDQRGTKNTISFEPHFGLTTGVANDEGRPDKPLATYNCFSCLKFIIISDGTRKVVTANIPPAEAESLLQKGQFCLTALQEMKLRKELDEVPESEVNGEDKASPAYTERFKMGALKDKSPAEILIDDPKSGYETLRGQYEFLAKNCEKYPANKTLMNAINDAVNLLKQGKLNRDDANKSAAKRAPVYVIYDGAPKSSDYRNVRPPKLPTASYIKIVCDFNLNNPFRIEIMNCNAPVAELPGGKINIQMAQAVNKETKTFLCSFEEFCGLLGSIHRVMTQFETLHAEDVFRNAEKCFNHNREEALRKKSEQQMDNMSEYRGYAV